jgi:hypothetical protein
MSLPTERSRTWRRSPLFWIGFAAVTAALLIGAAGQLNAALPPTYEIWRQFRMVLDDSEIPRMLEQRGAVDRIERKDGAYQVWAGKCFVPVTFVPLPPLPDNQLPPPGAVRIRAERGTMQCR